MARTIGTYKSYNFTDKDPIIDQIRTVIKDEGARYADIHEQSGVAVSTLFNWFNGDTKRPQYATVMAVVRGLGYDLKLVRGAKVIDLNRQRKRA